MANGALGKTGLTIGKLMGEPSPFEEDVMGLKAAEGTKVSER
jgi:hypothetical protein